LATKHIKNNQGLVGFVALVLVGQPFQMLIPHDELYSTLNAN